MIRLFILSLACLLAACSSFPQNGSPSAWLKPGVHVSLPAPGITPAIHEQQLLTATVKGKAQSLIVLLNADEQKLSLAGLSSLGIRLFKLDYDHNGIHAEQSIVVPEIPPANQVLADIMLSYWPTSSWQSKLPTGWTLSDTVNRRQLKDNHGQVITEIHYDTQNDQRRPIRVQQFIFGYEIAIQHLEE
ncbi:DUF3261 domain-containing protein [Xenorhabdus bovienii]|uniref:DUF3261 domain-containing protein n=1 Tax=Xenorhabdus bovienii TaxID=40576 RepID=A0AAJ1J3C8_XENBV|nr:DUF3261 domain-containing protein [Xenorhabdus bovienii]MDE1476795.1 DUF3261 domain-containing protein [Xenorhabdus bovienii]MDE1490682.1 DUF3261 domain-containing protein [Xenorhabdus bovienii]MDE9508547.1 DUF3261 domain-containing protein [Xenorhabdus bovienii]MDE9520182.1 DUF3261 domain-containing protein [Xenorhabdus bovienii]